MAFWHHYRLSILCFSLSFCTLPCVAQEQKVAPEKYTVPATDEGLPGAGPIRRYDWFQNLWRNRRSAWATKVQQDQNSVVFFGDSITQGWDDDFKGYFPHLKKANRGISGDTTRGMLIRLQEDVIALNPTCVVMLMGTNDLEEGAEPDTIASNVQLIINSLEAHNAKLPIVLCQVFPSSNQKKRPAEKIRRINELLSKIAQNEPQVTLIETWTLFANDQGDAKPEEFPDLLHPNDQGYAKWAAALDTIFSTLALAEVESHNAVAEEGFQSLFNGNDLNGWGYRPTSDELRKIRDGWKDHPEWPIVEQAVSFDGMKSSPDGRYAAIGGALVVRTPTEGRKIQQIYTTQDFAGDFTLKLEFRASPNADSGIYLRGPQLQCRDYLLAGPYKKLSKYKPQDWNTMEIRVTGETAICTCNEEVIESAFQLPAVGPIGFEGDRGQVEYRNIRIKLAQKADYGLLKPTADKDAWTFETSETGAGEIEAKDDCIIFTTTQTSDQDWHVQAYQTPVALEEGTEYEISFEAKSAEGVPVTLSALINVEDWHNVGLYEELYLDEEFEKFRFNFTASGVVENSNRVGFIFGGKVGSVEVKNLVLRPRP